MKNLTKHLIMDTFVRQLNEKPLKDITVKSICEECEINRNTFYYHFIDIYAVLSDVFNNELNAVIREYNDTASWEESFKLACKFAADNKKAVYHIYYSMKREELELYIYNCAGKVMERFVKNKSLGINASDGDIRLISSFFQSALTTMVIEWIATGMTVNSDYVIKRIGELFDGSIDSALRISEKEMHKNQTF